MKRLIAFFFALTFCSVAYAQSGAKNFSEITSSITGLYWVFLISVPVLTTAICLLMNNNHTYSRKSLLLQTPKYTKLWHILLVVLYLSSFVFFWNIFFNKSILDLKDELIWRPFLWVGLYCIMLTLCYCVIIQFRLKNYEDEYAGWLESISMLCCTVFFWGLLLGNLQFRYLVSGGYLWIMSIFGGEITFWGTLLAVIVIPVCLYFLFNYVILPLSAPGGIFYLIGAEILLLIPSFISSFPAITKLPFSLFGWLFIFGVHFVMYFFIICKTYNHLVLNKCPNCHHMYHTKTIDVEDGPNEVGTDSHSETYTNTESWSYEKKEIKTTTHYHDIIHYRTELHHLYCKNCHHKWTEKLFFETKRISTPTSKEIHTTTTRYR